MEIKNRRASFDFAFEDTLVAGIQLTGAEIKSIREGKASITDSFCYFNGGELFLKNAYIAPYKFCTDRQYDERRDRRLLLTKTELNKWFQKAKTKGFTVVPSKMFINERGLCKVVVNLASGKKQYDKREAIKERDIDRQMKREV